MKSIYDVIHNNIKVTDERTEKANRPRAEKLYKLNVIPRLENELHSKCVEIVWIPYDKIDKQQSNGKDGYFLFENGTNIFFQEKTHLDNTLDSTTKWNPKKDGYSHIMEIVNHGKNNMGWGGKLNNVSLLFIFYKDCTVVLGKRNLGELYELANYCVEIYKLWDGHKVSQKISYDGIMYRLNAVAEKNTASKTMIINLSETTIKDLNIGIKIYKN